ncbi:type II secretion system protein GspD, partial [Escherichia coli]|nr:type II secretion system protein GspD [Escherichia coli]
KRNLMLFIRPTIIRERDGFRHASAEKYQSFNQEQVQSRGKETTALTLNEEQLRLSPDQDDTAFRKVKAAIAAFYAQEM